jgi:hypothetical protein
MGKAARTRKKTERQAKRRAAKEAQKALFQRYAAEGRKKGSNRARASKIRLVGDTQHPNVRCGNVGCKACFPHLNKDRTLRLVA